MVDPNILELGSRSGSYAALAFFCVIFGLLAVAIARDVRRRWPARRRTALTLGILWFACPITLLYASSMSGFYEAEIHDDRVVLHYLHPVSSELLLVDIAEVRSVPAFKGLWRVHVRHSHDDEYVSVARQREAVEAATARMQGILSTRGRYRSMNRAQTASPVIAHFKAIVPAPFDHRNDPRTPPMIAGSDEFSSCCSVQEARRRHRPGFATALMTEP